MATIPSQSRREPSERDGRDDRTEDALAAAGGVHGDDGGADIVTCEREASVVPAADLGVEAFVLEGLGMRRRKARRFECIGDVELAILVVVDARTEFPVQRNTPSLPSVARTDSMTRSILYVRSTPS